jgi:hypothetical protein
VRFGLGFCAGRLGWDECICRASEVHKTELGNHVAILGQSAGIVEQVLFWLSRVCIIQMYGYRYVDPPHI